MLFHILTIYKPSYTATPVNRFFRSRSFWSISLIKVHSVTGAKQYVYVRLQYIQCGYNITKQRIFARRVAWVAAATTAAPQFAAHGQQSCNGSILADCCASAAPHAVCCRSAAAVSSMRCPGACCHCAAAAAVAGLQLQAEAARGREACWSSVHSKTEANSTSVSRCFPF